MPRLLSATLLVLVTAVQGNIFDFFGQNQQQAQQPQTGSAQYRALREAAPCSTYICPATLQCVTAPRDCDCPNFQDVKCAVGQDHVVCARSCDSITAALKLQD